MNEHASTNGEIGKARRRVEDRRLIQGAGRYPDDLAPRDALHLAFVRSPLPHARVRSLDVSAASRAPGVVAVYTAEHFAPPGPAPVARAQPAGTPRESMQTAPGG